MNNEGVMKSAILMLALGEEEAAEVMKFLSPKEVQKIGAAMTSLSSIGREQVDEVVHHFLTEADVEGSINTNSTEYIRSVLNKALGEDEAVDVLQQIFESRDAPGIVGLRAMDANTVSEFIQNEHPQIIATILVHLEPEQASKIIGGFPESLQKDVMLRIATLDGVKPFALRELDDVMNKFITANETVKKKSMGGIKVAADIINFMSGDNESAVMEGLKKYDDDMAQKIMDEMFVFDDIMDIDDKSIQVILKEVQSEMLIIALKGTTEEMREKIFKNMSSRAAEMMKEDLESKGPVKLSEVEAEQRKILQIVRKLADDGQIQIIGKGDGEQYV